MLILDTDHLTIIQRTTEPAYTVLRNRLQQARPRESYTTVVSFEEQMRGWLTVLAQSRDMHQEVTAYRRLHALITFFGDIPVLDFDMTAADLFLQLRRARVRIGSMDLKIAAITLSHGAVLLSRNLTDFQQVPGLHVEDWTQPGP
jgi:tRNA(fMet)-specific endonuclease VapC